MERNYTDSEINSTDSFYNCTRYEFDTAIRVAFNTTWLFISVLIIAGNSIIIDIYRRVPKTRTSSNYCLILLAISDLTFGVCGPVMVTLYFRTNELTGSYLQILFYSTLVFSASATTFGLLALTYDRFVAIWWPLKYRTNASLGRKIGMTTLVLPPAVILAIVPLLWHNSYNPMECITDLNMLAALKLEFFMYIILPAFFLCNVLKIAMLLAIFYTTAQFISRRKATAVNNDSSSSKMQIQAMKSGLLILGSYFTCWFPVVLTTATQVYGPESFRQNTTLTLLRSCFLLPATLNSALNPVIYAFRVPVFKSEVQGILCRCQKENTGSIISPRTRSLGISETGLIQNEAGSRELSALR